MLLPPSETKRPGGGGDPVDLRSLRYPSLLSRRRVLVRSLTSLAKHPDAMMAALKLGRTQTAEVGRNRTLTTSPTMPVLDRYTGVLFDALEAESLSPTARAWAGEHVLVQSALFGLVGALDLIPAYRLSYDSRLPGIALKQHWSAAVEKALRGAGGLVLDLRSAGYASLGPAPVRPGSLRLRVVTEASDGRTRALNHFNKTAKGRFARALIENAAAFESTTDLLDWAEGSGFVLRAGTDGELDLVVEQVVGRATV